MKKKTIVGLLLYTGVTFFSHYIFMGKEIGDYIRIAIMIGACFFAIIFLNKNEETKNKYRIEFNLEKIDEKLQEKKDIYPNSSWNDIVIVIVVLLVATVNLFIL